MLIEDIDMILSSLKVQIDVGFLELQKDIEYSMNILFQYINI